MAKWSQYNTLVSENGGGALLFNARTGSLVRLSPLRHQELANLETIPQDLCTFLAEQGFLIDDSMDELEAVQETLRRARVDVNTFSATVELTDACNFRCVYCYQAHTPEHMTDTVAEKVTAYLSTKLGEVAHLHVNWFGGEPLLRFETMKHMSAALMSAARRHGKIFTQFLTTNGYLLTKAVAVELMQLGVRSVQITVDGDEYAHDQLRVTMGNCGTYKKVLAGCESVIRAGLELMVRVNLNWLNADRMELLLADLRSCGISPANTIIHVVRAVDHGNCSQAAQWLFMTNRDFAQHWARILCSLAEHGFGLPTLSPRGYNCAFDLPQTVMINRDGTLRHCSSSSALLGEFAESGGEINQTALGSHLKSRIPLDDPDCRKCAYLPTCMGGCGYLQQLGHEKCNPEKYVFPELIRLMAAHP